MKSPLIAGKSQNHVEIISSEVTIKLIKPDEIWKRLYINGEKLGYYVSNYGRIFGLYRKKILSQEITNKGYHRINIFWPDHKFHKHYFVHRLVGMLFVNGYDESLTINHIDGNHHNNNSENLEWVSLEDNEKHATDTGLHPFAEDHPNSLYSNDQIRKVCELLEQKLSYKKIQLITGVGRHTIYDIKHRKSWLHVSKDYEWSSDPNTYYHHYYKQIISYFEKGYKTKEIMRLLGYDYSELKIRRLISRIRWKYNKFCSKTFNDYPKGVGSSEPK